MKFFFPVSCILSVIIFLFLLNVKADGPYECLQFVQQWPVAVCSLENGARCKRATVQTFTVHGIWQGNRSGASVEFCNKNSILEPTLQQIKNTQLVKDLHFFWPDFISAKDDAFWKRQWQKHGTCSEGVLSQLQFLNMACNKMKSFNITSMLLAGGLAPNNQMVDFAKVKQAIKCTIGKEVILRCKKKAGTNLDQLQEIILCFDKVGNSLEDCDTNLNQCPNNFLFSK